jgi:hypothetical protein
MQPQKLMPFSRVHSSTRSSGLICVRKHTTDNAHLARDSNVLPNTMSECNTGRHAHLDQKRLKHSIHVVRVAQTVDFSCLGMGGGAQSGCTDQKPQGPSPRHTLLQRPQPSHSPLTTLSHNHAPKHVLYGTLCSYEASRMQEIGAITLYLLRTPRQRTGRVRAAGGPRVPVPPRWHRVGRGWIPERWAA